MIFKDQNLGNFEVSKNYLEAFKFTTGRGSVLIKELFPFPDIFPHSLSVGDLLLEGGRLTAIFDGHPFIAAWWHASVQSTRHLGPWVLPLWGNSCELLFPGVETPKYSCR